jgi:hypothetical protein
MYQQSNRKKLRFNEYNQFKEICDMFITERKFVIFKFANIYFADEPLAITAQDWDVVTYHSYKNWEDFKGYEKNKYFTTIIDLRHDIDAIWKRINRQHKRHIRRAEKNGTNVTVSDNYEWFHQINKKCLEQKKIANPLGLNSLSSQFMEKYGILLVAEHQGEIIGGNLYFHDENNTFFVEGVCQNKKIATENRKLSIDANCYLHWEAMQYFKDMDIINYDVGEVSSDNRNIHHQMNGGEYFRRCFGGDIIPRYKYIKFNSQITKSLLSSWNFLLSGLFP